MGFNAPVPHAVYQKLNGAAMTPAANCSQQLEMTTGSMTIPV